MAERLGPDFVDNEGNRYKKESLLSEQKIRSRISEVAITIESEYSEEERKELVIIGVLTGAIPTMGALMENITDPNIQYAVIGAKSYNGQESSGDVEIYSEPKIPLKGKHIVLVEDIIDTGETIKRLIGYLKEKGAKSLSIFTLLMKREALKEPIDESELRKLWIGFEIPKVWVEGFGLDTDGRDRNGGSITFRKYN